jgi:hypothetical protein
MPQLYTVRFTTKTLVKKFDARGKLIGEGELSSPITFTALPLATAQSYSMCDNFVLEKYVPDARGSGKTHGWGEAATKKFQRHRPAPASSSSKPVKAKAPAHSAARTGDLSAALNVGSEA